MKKIRQLNYFSRSLMESFNFIKESKRSIFFILYFFLLFFLVGFFLPTPSYIGNLINQIVKGLLLKTQNLNTLQLIQYIFFNNFSVSAIAILLGFILGIIPLLISLTNGYLLGYVCKISVFNLGWLSLWKVFPHGIFELPAVIIALGLGFNLGKSLFSKNPDKDFFRKLVLSLKVLLFVVLPLLIIATFIEGALIGLFR